MEEVLIPLKTCTSQEQGRFCVNTWIKMEFLVTHFSEWNEKWVMTMFRVKTVIVKIIIIVIMTALINDYDDDEDNDCEKKEDQNYEEDTSSRLSV